MNKKNILLGIVIVVCVAFTFRGLFWSDGAKIQKRRDLADELAAWIAREASAGTKGKLLILAPVEDARDPFPKQLGKRLESHMRTAGFDPIEIERVPYNPQLESTGLPVTREKFLELLNAHADCAVVASLVGIPPLTGADLPEKTRPHIIVASVVLMPYLKDLPPGIIDFAIEVKQDPSNDKRADPALGELSNYFILFRPP